MPKPNALRLKYGAVADELVVLFDGALHSDVAFDFIDTPDHTYAAIKIDMSSGAVIGVLVYPLAALAVRLHPEWRSAITPSPSSTVANHIVTDIKRLYDRYGLLPDEGEPN